MADDTRDKPSEVIEGDLHEFRAYRRELKRAVMRFVLFSATGKAALFVQIALGKHHTLALEAARETLGQLFPFDDLSPADVSTAIKVLDTRDLAAAETGKHGHMAAQNTKFEAQGATVEFNADPAIGAWKQVTAVRRVRRALKTDASAGTAEVLVQLAAGPRPQPRGDVAQWRCRPHLPAGPAELEEVWTILDQVLGDSRPGTGT